MIEMYEDGKSISTIGRFFRLGSATVRAALVERWPDRFEAQYRANAERKARGDHARKLSAADVKKAWSAYLLKRDLTAAGASVGVTRTAAANAFDRTFGPSWKAHKPRRLTRDDVREALEACKGSSATAVARAMDVSPRALTTNLNKWFPDEWAAVKASNLRERRRLNEHRKPTVAPVGLGEEVVVPSSMGRAAAMRSRLGLDDSDEEP